MSVKIVSHQHVQNGFKGFDSTFLLLIFSKRTPIPEIDILANLTGLSCYVLPFETPQNGGREVFAALKDTHFRIERDWSLFLVFERSVQTKYSQRPRNDDEVRRLAADISSKISQRAPARGPIYPTNQGVNMPIQNQNLLQPNRALSGQVNIASSSAKMAEWTGSIPYNQSWKTLLVEDS